MIHIRLWTFLMGVGVFIMLLFLGAPGLEFAFGAAPHPYVVPGPVRPA